MQFFKKVSAAINRQFAQNKRLGNQNIAA